jgi:hypothetical protein
MVTCTHPEDETGIVAYDWEVDEPFMAIPEQDDIRLMPIRTDDEEDLVSLPA